MLFQVFSLFTRNFFFDIERNVHFWLFPGKNFLRGIDGALDVNISIFKRKYGAAPAGFSGR